MSKKFALLDFADGFNVVHTSWTYEEEGQLFCKWPGRKTQEEHEKAVRKEMAAQEHWEGKMVTEEIGYFDTFERARKKFRAAERGDDVHTDPDKKRVPKPNSKYESPASSEDENPISDVKKKREKPIQIANLASPPPPPTSLSKPRGGTLDNFLRAGPSNISRVNSPSPANGKPNEKKRKSSENSGATEANRKKLKSPDNTKTAGTSKNKSATSPGSSVMLKNKPATPKERPATPKERPATPKERPATPKERPATPKERPATLPPKERPATLPPKERPATLPPKERPATPKEKPAEETKEKLGQRKEQARSTDNVIKQKSPTSEIQEISAETTTSERRKSSENETSNKENVPLIDGGIPNQDAFDDSFSPPESDMGSSENAVSALQGQQGPPMPFRVNPIIFGNNQEFQKHVVRELMLIRLSISKRPKCGCGGTAEGRQSAIVVDSEDDDDYQLIETVSDLVAWNKKLNTDKAYLNKRVKQLALNGGRTIDKVVKGILSKIISCEVGAQYSWLGAKRKKKFEDLKGVVKLILGAVRATEVKGKLIFSGVTKDDMVKSIADWLRQQIGKKKSRDASSAANAGNGEYGANEADGSDEAGGGNEADESDEADGLFDEADESDESDESDGLFDEAGGGESSEDEVREHGDDSGDGEQDSRAKEQDSSGAEDSG